jgi:hypothetical protein
MSTQTEALSLEILGNKPYCTKAQIYKLCLDAGLFGSYSGAEAALKTLPWIQISPKRKVVPRSAALEFFRDFVEAKAV